MILPQRAVMLGAVELTKRRAPMSKRQSNAAPACPAASLIRLIALLALCPAQSQAMGGHFDIDDAVVLDPGRCQVELWAAAARGAGPAAQHAGTACRVASIEVGLNLDRNHNGGTVSHAVGVQLKALYSYCTSCGT